MAPLQRALPCLLLIKLIIDKQSCSLKYGPYYGRHAGQAQQDFCRAANNVELPWVMPLPDDRLC